LIELHKEGFDLVFTFQLMVMLMIRSWMVSMKYATFSEKMSNVVHSRQLTLEEIESEMMAFAWLSPTPSLLLQEIAQSLVR